MTLLKGARLAAYEIQAPIGTGGMGEVYRARDTRLGRNVAIKVLAEADGAAEMWDRFEREARAAAALTHPNICAVYDVGEYDGRRFPVMELIDGVTLREYIDEKPLEPAAARSFGAQIADALDTAHRNGIIHRDIKPANVMIVDGRHAKVLDFGIARRTTAASHEQTAQSLTVSGAIVGTPAYLAPELWSGARADVASDLWSLGAVIHEMLSGRQPFSGTTVFDLGTAIVQQPAPPLPPSVPSALRSIVERCLCKRPEDRYQSAGEVRAALEAAESLTAVATPAPETRQTRLRVRALWPAAAAATVIAVAALVVWIRLPANTQLRLSTGASGSANRDANEAFELSMQFQSVQNDLPRANQALERALALDPRFAEALRYHATNNAILLLNGYSNDASLLYKAEQELRQVAAIDPDLPGLPAAFTTIYLTQGRKELVPWDSLNRAVQTDPLHVNNRLWRGIASWLSGDLTSASQDFRTVLDKRPLYGPARMFLGETMREGGDVPGAIREIEKVLEQAPNNISAISGLTLAYLDNKEVEKARTLLNGVEKLYAGNYVWRQAVALLLAVEGERERALAAMDDETLKHAAAAFTATLSVAEFYGTLADTTKAIEWLERSIRNGDERTAWFRKSPRLASIHQDPRFQRIIDSVERRKRDAAR